MDDYGSGLTIQVASENGAVRTAKGLISVEVPDFGSLFAEKPVYCPPTEKKPRFDALFGRFSPKNLGFSVSNSTRNSQNETQK